MRNSLKFYASLIALFALTHTGYAQKTIKKMELNTIAIKGVYAVNNEKRENIKRNAFDCPWPCGGGLQITSKAEESDCPWPCGGKSKASESVIQDCPAEKLRNWFLHNQTNCFYNLNKR
jgi:hypothetical protein